MKDDFMFGFFMCLVNIMALLFAEASQKMRKDSFLHGVIHGSWKGLYIGSSAVLVIYTLKLITYFIYR